MGIEYSQHALSRIRQRGVREADIPVVVAAGTPIDDESVFLLDRDVEREIRKRKQEITALERLRGCRVVIAGEKIVTIYRPSRKTEKRLMRGQHKHRSHARFDPSDSFINNGEHTNAY